jgi:hypothetical protein
VRFASEDLRIEVRIAPKVPEIMITFFWEAAIESSKAMQFNQKNAILVSEKCNKHIRSPESHYQVK